jgi:predicted alpha/beta superfamily hydrolase
MQTSPANKPRPEWCAPYDPAASAAKRQAGRQRFANGMAFLRSIHEEIKPQLDALRAAQVATAMIGQDK